MGAYDQKQLYPHHEIDFGRRVAAKFRFNPEEFWGNEEFPLIGRNALYPDENDQMFELAETIKNRLTNAN